MNDEELIRQYREGDEDAFWELRRGNRPQCFDNVEAPLPDWLRVGKGLLWRHLSDFENIFDEVLRNTASLGGYDPARGYSYRAYLNRALRNRVYSWGKRDPRRRRLVLESELAPDEESVGVGRFADPQGGPLQPESGPANLAKSREMLRLIESALAELSDEDRDIIGRRKGWGRYPREQSYGEIAGEYGMKESTCRTRFQRAWKRLLKKLREKGLLGDEE